MTRKASLLAVVAAAALALLLSGCSTSEGSTLKKVIGAEQGPQTPSRPSTQSPFTGSTGEITSQPTPQAQGLEIQSEPSRAEVWIDGAYRGKTPLIVSNISTGWHRLLLRKEGYYETSIWMEYAGPYMLYQTNLVRITGFLQLSVSPEGSMVTVGAILVRPGVSEIPAGMQTVVARHFGYVDFRQSIVIAEKTVTPLSIELAPAPFAVPSASVARDAINPDNPGLLGQLELNFSVTGPGAGSVSVIDPSGATVYSTDLPAFTTWDQHLEWDLHGPGGKAIEDGEYTVVLSARGPDSVEEQLREIPFQVDRTLTVFPRSLWSGSAGLLFVPTTDVLPPGDFQASILGSAYIDSTDIYAPMQMGARIGLPAHMEMDVSVGTIFCNGYTRFTGCVAARWNMQYPKDSYGVGSALEAKVSYQYNPDVGVLMSDTFANFTGISFAVPLQLSLGRVSFLFAPGVTGSLWHPFGTQDPNPVAWLSLKAGILVDIGQFMGGVSIAARTEPLPEGISSIAFPVPFQVGAEVHWLIPDTHIFVSAMAAGQYEDTDNFFFTGGAGAGFLY